MIASTRVATVGMTVLGLLALPMGSASAESADGDMVPLSAKYRACDFGRVQFVGTTATGSGQATISTAGSNTVTATVNMGVLRPFTPYQVRLIQGPRPGTQRCNAGDPGVASAVLNTDGNGIGTVTVSAPKASGSTNAWVFIDGPTDPGQIRGDFYTSDMTTKLS